MAVYRVPVSTAAAAGVLGALQCQVKLQETLPVPGLKRDRGSRGKKGNIKEEGRDPENKSHRFSWGPPCSHLRDVSRLEPQGKYVGGGGQYPLMYARHFTHAILFHLASCPMKGRELTFVQCLTMYQALCMKLLCTSWSRNDHPHFTGEDDWGSETLNSLPYKSSGVRIKVVMPNLKVYSPKCTAKGSTTARTWWETSG